MQRLTATNAISAMLLVLFLRLCVPPASRHARFDRALSPDVIRFMPFSA
jgi:hypothetical protein